MGAAFGVTVAMGDFHELAAESVQERKGFGAPFDGVRLRPPRSAGHQIARQNPQQVHPELAAQLAIRCPTDGVAELARGRSAPITPPGISHN